MTNSCFIEAVLDSMRIALPLQEVDRVIRAVAVHTVPAAGGCLLGAADVAGELVAIYDLRKLLGLPGKPLRASDRIVLTRAPNRCGLVVDQVLGTVAPETVELTDEFALHAAGLRGVTRSRDGVLLVHKLRRLLALDRAIPITADA